MYFAPAFRRDSLTIGVPDPPPTVVTFAVDICILYTLDMKISLKAAIFDLDGTILSNEDEYGKAFKFVLASLGVQVKDEYPQIEGVGVKENWSFFVSKYHVSTDKSLEELVKETQDYYLSHLETVDIKKGFVELIASLREVGVATALATSNSWYIIEQIFDKFGLEQYFDATITGEEVLALKPAPDLFLEAARKLGIEPNECIVFEDAPSGIEAAQAAGMKVVAVARDNEHAKTLIGANLVIKSYDEITVEMVKELVEER